MKLSDVIKEMEEELKASKSYLSSQTARQHSKTAHWARVQVLEVHLPKLKAIEGENDWISVERVKELLKEQRHICQIERDKNSYVDAKGNWYILAKDILSAEEPKIFPQPPSNEGKKEEGFNTYLPDNH